MWLEIFAMPKIISLSEFNRNQSAVLEELSTNKQPIYLTRNGASSAVVMDTTYFENSQLDREAVKQEEMNIYAKLVAGMNDYVQGNVLSKEEMKRRI